METKPNEPANPAKGWDKQQNSIEYKGLTKREYFAGQFASGYASAGSTGMPSPDALARYIVAATDALIAELNKEKA